MKTTYTVIKPDGTQTDGEVDWPKEPGYTKIAALVRPLLDGAELEHVNVLFQNTPHDMFVDEEGLNKGLKRNEKATAIYRRYWTGIHPDRDPESISYIAGTAIIFHRRVWY